jgi:hypothetical protein
MELMRELMRESASRKAGTSKAYYVKFRRDNKNPGHKGYDEFYVVIANSESHAEELLSDRDEITRMKTVILSIEEMKVGTMLQIPI